MKIPKEIPNESMQCDCKIVEKYYGARIEFCNLHKAAALMLDAMKYAAGCLNHEWVRCDDEDGQECKGIQCEMGEHRALCFLDDAIAEAESPKQAVKK